MASDTPFAEPEEDRTIIVPRPGGSRRSAPASSPPPVQSPPSAIGPAQAIELPEAGANALVAAAATLIDLTVRLRNCAAHANVEALRERVLAEVRRFEERVGRLGLAANQTRAAHYVLCATIDDTVLNSPWGSTSIWTHRSLVSSRYNEATGGERFFMLLDNARRNPGGNLALLELMHVCLSIGFAGRFRLLPQGASELVRIREELFQTIRNQKPALERDLSPSWRGLGIGHKPLLTVIPPWVSAAAAVLLVLLLLIGLRVKLNEYSDPAFEQLAKLPPSAPVLSRVVDTPSMKPSGMRVFLESEIRQGLVAVTETASEVMVSIRGRGMFNSGSASPRPDLSSLLDRIGQALRDEPGAVLIAGHTDNIPIHSARFPSNWHLSQARAQAVQERLIAAVGGARVITAQGFADTRPLADNATAEGQERNRRIEIIIHKELPAAARL